MIKVCLNLNLIMMSHLSNNKKCIIAFKCSKDPATCKAYVRKTVLIGDVVKVLSLSWNMKRSNRSETIKTHFE